ncbi:MAG: hypothetical protein WC346_16820 [Methanogenium sp.]|jgi:hypothetical protein
MKKLIVVMVLFVLSFVFISCVGAPKNSLEGQLGAESKNIGENQLRLITSQPSPNIKFSNERENLRKRAERLNDPNKLGYVYLFVYGSREPIAYSVVKGKISCLSSYLVPDQNIVNGAEVIGYSSANCVPVVVQQPDIDGSYGTNGEGVFWFDENDVMWDWNMGYSYTDQPVSIWSVPKIARK